MLLFVKVPHPSIVHHLSASRCLTWKPDVARVVEVRHLYVYAGRLARDVHPLLVACRTVRGLGHSLPRHTASRSSRHVHDPPYRSRLFRPPAVTYSGGAERDYGPSWAERPGHSAGSGADWDRTAAGGGERMEPGSAGECWPVGQCRAERDRPVEVCARMLQQLPSPPLPGTAIYT